MEYLIVLMLFASALGFEDVTLGMSEANPASSCNEIYQRNPTSKGTIGLYWIRTNEGTFHVTCNMNLKCGDIEGGWMQVVDVDMNRDDSCPGTWLKITTPRRLCLGSSAAGCASAHFYTNGLNYQHICGQAKAYQKGTMDAFVSRSESIDGIYVDGVSITIGSPRKHVWTYAVGLSDDYNYPNWNCPCAARPGPPSPAFVGNNYYCESGDVGTLGVSSYYLSDALWNGAGCTVYSGCCAQIGMPWFYRKLPVPVADDFEVRICKDEGHSNEDVAVENLEIFVH